MADLFPQVPAARWRRGRTGTAQEAAQHAAEAGVVVGPREWWRIDRDPTLPASIMLDRLAHSAQGRYRIISQLDEMVIGLRLSEIARRVCHELGHGLFAAEAIGLALNLRINRAVGVYVFVGCEAHCAHVAELVVHSQSRRRA